MKQLTRADLEELIRAELSKVFDLHKVYDDDDTIEENDDEEGPTAALMKPFTKLARGVLEEDFIIIPKKALIELMKEAKHSPGGKKILAKHVTEAQFGVRGPTREEKIHSLCNRHGYRTYQHFLNSVNQLNKAEKGDLGK